MICGRSGGIGTGGGTGTTTTIGGTPTATITVARGHSERSEVTNTLYYYCVHI